MTRKHPSIARCSFGPFLRTATGAGAGCPGSRRDARGDSGRPAGPRGGSGSAPRPSAAPASGLECAPAAARVGSGAPAARSRRRSACGAGTGPIQLMSLRLMRDKGIISQAEYDSAVHDLVESVGTQAGSQEHVVVGKWATTLYGFVEADSIYDSTRSLNDLAGNALIARAGTTAGDNSRWQFGVRNSRIGFRIKAPEFNGVRTSAMIEADFLGTQLPVGTGPYSDDRRDQPGARHRGRVLHEPDLPRPAHEPEGRDAGRRHSFRPVLEPLRLAVGVPTRTPSRSRASRASSTSRTPQFRISKTIKASPITFEAAVAAVRPAQRDGGLPDGQAGLRFAVDSWTGVQTVGSDGYADLAALDRGDWPAPSRLGQ